MNYLILKVKYILSVSVRYGVIKRYPGVDLYPEALRPKVKHQKLRVGVYKDMALRRTKRLDIYNVVGHFYGAGVEYSAHAILNDNIGTAILLKSAVQGEGQQNYAINHPDQQYWVNHALHIRNQLGPHLNNIRRIEIDCTLMPCVQQGGCRDRSPALIRALFPNGALNNVALRIFSYRSEIPIANLPVGDSSDHRYYDTNTSQQDQGVAYNGHHGWGWATTGFTNLQYANDFQAIMEG